MAFKKLFLWHENMNKSCIKCGIVYGLDFGELWLMICCWFNSAKMCARNKERWDIFFSTIQPIPQSSALIIKKQISRTLYLKYVFIMAKIGARIKTFPGIGCGTVGRIGRFWHHRSQIRIQQWTILQNICLLWAAEKTKINEKEAGNCTFLWWLFHRRLGLERRLVPKNNDLNQSLAYW